MSQQTTNFLVSKVLIHKSIEDVWLHWNNTDSIKQWNIPFPDWHCPVALNDLRENGSFFFRMEKQDGSEGFDYTGKYNTVIPYQRIESTGDDGRKTLIEFQQLDGYTAIIETFEADRQTALDLQQRFTDAVLNRFKIFVEEIEA